MLSQEVFKFLADLKKNNTREWFAANKTRYETAKTEFERFLNELIPAIAAFDKDIRVIPARDCMFRIFRDTRFSADKTPYKTNLGAYIAGEGRKSSGAGYYVHIEPGNCFLAGGVYMPTPEMLKAMRQEIYYHADEFRKITNSAAFRKYFGQVQAIDKLSRPPKNFPPDFADIELLKFKSYFIMHPLSDRDISSPGLRSRIAEVFREMLPMNRFLRRACEK